MAGTPAERFNAIVGKSVLPPPQQEQKLKTDQREEAARRFVEGFAKRDKMELDPTPVSDETAMKLARLAGIVRRDNPPT